MCVGRKEGREGTIFCFLFLDGWMDESSETLPSFEQGHPIMIVFFQKQAVVGSSTYLNDDDDDDDLGEIVCVISENSTASSRRKLCLLELLFFLGAGMYTTGLVRDRRW